MRRKSGEPISLKFIFFVFAIFLVFVFYLSAPNDMKKLNKSKTFEEMLEYSNKPVIKKSTETETSISEENIQQYDIQPETQKDFAVSTKKEPKAVKPKQITLEEYNNLLDTLAQYPARNLTAVTGIVNKLLKLKGYPENAVRIVLTDINQERSKTQGNYLVANFDFTTGDLNISSQALSSLDNKVVIAVLAHELDHFDKLAKVCSYMGIDKFQKLFEENNINNLNTAFWRKASSYTSADDINVKLYQEALKRFITQNDLELTSSYSDFYRLSENMRNPLEISAYEVSDYVYNHFKIPITDGPMKKMTQTFNDVDWAIYNVISKDSLIKNERIALFDYFFIEAILSKFPNLKQQFDICINQKNGDLTSFWLDFENSQSSFYQKGKMDNKTYETMLSLLSETENKIKQGITPKEISTALKYKINTLSSNLVYPNAIINLKNTTLNYLKYIKREGISDFEQELKGILTLICIENELYKQNADKEISLYYIKIPKELQEIYTINKNKKFLFIYNNPSFKQKMHHYPNEQTLLSELLNQQKLDVRINH